LKCKYKTVGNVGQAQVNCFSKIKKIKGFLCSCFVLCMHYEFCTRPIKNRPSDF